MNARFCLLPRASCCGWRCCTHTHLLHAHFSAHGACTDTSAHSHACAQHAWLKCLKRCVCSVHVVDLHLAFSVSCLTHLCRLLPDFDVPQRRTLRISARAPRSWGCLAKSGLHTGYEPKEFDKITADPDLHALTSRKPHARTLDCSVFPQCLKPLFRTFLIVMLLFR